MAANERWVSAKGIPRATHGSPDKPLKIGDIEIPCYVLSNGKRVITQTGFLDALGLSRGGKRREGGGGDQVAGLAALKSLKSFAPKSLTSVIAVEFSPRTGGRALGYEATVLADVCEMYLAAQDAGELTKQQEPAAERCKLLMRGFARVGIIALIDEATGYQADQSKRELEKFLNSWLSIEAASWVRMFPEEFFIEACRLHGWSHNPKTHGPLSMAHVINDLIYKRLDPELTARLDAYNPQDENGRRRNKQHQHFRRRLKPGEDSPEQHLRTMVTIATRQLKQAKDKDHFYAMYDTTFPKPEGFQSRLPFDEPKEADLLEGK